MAEHTPGPWQYGRRRHEGRDLGDHHVSCDSYCIATTDGNEANARLIAAAPELLAALEAIKDLTSSRSPAHALARAALTKARGGAP